MTTFDEILPKLKKIFGEHDNALEDFGEIIINRDLNGRVRLVLNERIYKNKIDIKDIAAAVSNAMGSHGFPPEDTILFESTPQDIIKQAPNFQPEGFGNNIIVVDRLATGGNWSGFTEPASGAPRHVFYSIKGGVGRTTAAAASAWTLAQAGKRVLILDLDLESPGLSSAFLPLEKEPPHGITDWLTEDLVGNGDSVLEAMISTSDLSHDGEIYVVPSYGKNPGEYIAKLGKVWMPKVGDDGTLEPWTKRLCRLLKSLENKVKPDAILIDSRAGIDEIAAACIGGLGATNVLLFALDGEQTWRGYDILFNNWHRIGVAGSIRTSLKMVAGMVPEDETGPAYFERLREQAWTHFTNYFYDEISPNEPSVDLFNFDESDMDAPHYPLPIRWNRGFTALRSLYSKLGKMDKDGVKHIFGSLPEYLLSGSSGDYNDESK